ncbi:low temperature requirement protein A [Nonomuraea sp. NPDC050663]|uniref:low temperature requirement protein A n=1 Tax=Nonomuraea sp. NPDC050663 TaxID=3364370 RepID=UPI0037A1AFE5
MTWLRPMRPRDVAESHRVATTLELFFDLFFVVAVAAAGVQLHERIVENHVLAGVLGYALVFYAIFLAWLQYTWFASAYDTGDIVFKLLTLVVMAGVVILAAGIPRMFEQDFTLGVTGYVVMRLALVAFWVRVARSDPERRPTAIRYAVGTTLAQCVWVSFLFVPEPLKLPWLVVGIVADMAVPAFAERAGRTPWHPHHIAERHGLFTIIVMGENALAVVNAVREGTAEHELHSGPLWLAAGGLVIVFSIWWLYFRPDTAHALENRRSAFVWGYGHYVVLASIAAIGAGLEAAVSYESGHAHISLLTAGLALAVPVALAVLSIWVVQVRPHGYGTIAFPVAAVLVLATAPLPTQFQSLVIGVVMIGLVASTTRP